jgi:hypothetical protein
MRQNDILHFCPIGKQDTAAHYRTVLLDNVKSRKDNSRLEWYATPSLALDAALVAATTDAEVTLLSPVSIPGVGASPVLLTVLNTVADKLDSMTTLITTRSVVIDTAGVAHEISIDSESNLEGTVGGKLGLHVLLTDDGVGLGALALVSVPVKRRIARAAVGASRSVHAGIVTGGVRSTVVGDNTDVNPVDPSAARLSTIAVTAASIARLGAAVDILSRESDNLTLVDTLTITHGLSSTESPAGTTVLLVTDILHGVALGPVGAGIEFLGGIGNLSSRELLHSPGVGMDVLHVDTKKTTSLALGHTSDGVVGSLPGLLLVVDLTDHAGADSDLLSEDSCSNEGKNKCNLIHCLNKKK